MPPLHLCCGERRNLLFGGTRMMMCFYYLNTKMQYISGFMLHSADVPFKYIYIYIYIYNI